MSQFKKLILKILLGNSDKNVKFSELTNLLIWLGFEMRISGGHHIFRRQDIPIRINLQREGDLAKAYQVKQVRNMIIEYKLSESDEE